jgi:hypothetical protein
VRNWGSQTSSDEKSEKMCYEIDKVTIYVLLSTKRATSVKNSLISSNESKKKNTQHKKLDQFSYSYLVELASPHQLHLKYIKLT